MTTRPSPSREPSLSRSFRSRRSSLESLDNAFSDEYALDSPVTIDNAPLGPVPPPRQGYFDDPFHDRNESNPSLPLNHLQPPLDRGSIAKRRLMIDDVPSSSTGGLGRSLSSSSRITIPRSQSPYTGPTAPSHPYSMYPQMTRASSVASQSTLRPGAETPFIPRGGPEHPYELYPQNTVPEEDEDITARGIPLGFPRSTNFQSSSGGSSSDVGDIIGSDGHIEQLPPYTRYADNTVAKGNMDDINRRRFSRMSQTTTQPSDNASNPNLPSTAASTTLLQPREQFEEETEAQIARKEGWRETWKEKMQKKTIAGLPLWGLITIILIVISSATIGGVVGGVIGNRQGAERAYANGVVTTIFLDAVPTTLGPNSSPLPTGHFQIPFNQSQEINQCIPSDDSYQYPAWGCMDIAYIGLNVYQEQGSNTMMASLEDFSVNTQDFRYGPQPPDFNGTSFVLQPMQDKDAEDWGVAMFFSLLFDKLSILPEHVFEANKRSVDSDFVARNVAAFDGEPLQPSQKPWFCFWNSTINEFFIYLNQHSPGSNAYAESYNYHQGSSVSYSLPTTTAFTFSSATSAVALQELTMTTSPTQAPTTFLAYNPTYPGMSSPTTAVNKEKRSYETSAPNVSNYPKLIKMVEKRQPSAPPEVPYVQPYCQMMQVLDDWSIVPIATVPTIDIDEIQYQTSTSTALPSGGSKLKRGYRNVVNDLESYCICEWTSCE